jgi:hypothetical protein
MVKSNSEFNLDPSLLNNEHIIVQASPENKRTFGVGCSRLGGKRTFSKHEFIPAIDFVFDCQLGRFRLDPFPSQ